MIDEINMDGACTQGPRDASLMDEESGDRPDVYKECILLCG